jgi:hypothetical protein
MLPLCGLTPGRHRLKAQPPNWLALLFPGPVFDGVVADLK